MERQPMQTVVIAKRDCYKVPVTLSAPGTLTWQFSTRKKNIAFGLFYRLPSSSASASTGGTTSANGSTHFTSPTLPGSSSPPAPPQSNNPSARDNQRKQIEETLKKQGSIQIEPASINERKKSGKTILRIDSVDFTATAGANGNNNQGDSPTGTTGSETGSTDGKSIMNSSGTHLPPSTTEKEKHHHSIFSHHHHHRTSPPPSIAQKVVGPEYVEILPIQRYESYKYTVTGSYTSPLAGTFLFIFDNSFSLNTSKAVTYSIGTAINSSAENDELDSEQATVAVSVGGIQNNSKISLLNTNSQSNNFKNNNNSSLIGNKNNGNNAFEEGQLCGWLLKKKNKRYQGWEKRWFVLIDSTLKYYKEPNDVLRGQVDLSKSRISKIPEKLAINIDSGAVLFHLRALNNKDFATWLSALNYVKSLQRLSAASMIANLSVSQQQMEQLKLNNSNGEVKNNSSPIDILRVHSRLNDLKQEIVESQGKSVNPSAVLSCIDELIFFTNHIINTPHHHFIVHQPTGSAVEADKESLYSANETFYDAEGIIDVASLSSSEEDIAVVSDESGESEEEKFFDEEEASEIEDFAVEGANLLTPKPQQSIDSQKLIVRRSALPGPMILNTVSFYSILKRSIGKDLSTISMPICLNEPLSILQRLCEDMEYADLLNKAAVNENQYERLLLVAAFAVSSYASTVTRAERKPFNSLLGETFEFDCPEVGYRFLAEKVSHRPVIVACLAESKDWSFWHDQKPKSKFWGKSIEYIQPGTLHVALKTTGEQFIWKKVTTSIKNIISGTRYLEHYGTMKIVNKTTGDHISLDFSKSSVSGALQSSSGQTVLKIRGSWNDVLYTESLTLTGKSDLLWKSNELPPNSSENYGFTKFAIGLNELLPGEAEFIASSDSRWRPDQRLYEEGRDAEAEAEKNRIEEKQRENRKIMEENGEQWVPKWFRPGIDEVTGEECWEYAGGYWESRASKTLPQLNLF